MSSFGHLASILFSYGHLFLVWNFCIHFSIHLPPPHKYKKNKKLQNHKKKKEFLLFGFWVRAFIFLVFGFLLLFFLVFCFLFFFLQSAQIYCHIYSQIISINAIENWKKGWINGFYFYQKEKKVEPEKVKEFNSKNHSTFSSDCPVCWIIWFYS